MYEPTVEIVFVCNDALAKVPIQPSDVNQSKTPVTSPKRL